MAEIRLDGKPVQLALWDTACVVFSSLSLWRGEALACVVLTGGRWWAVDRKSTRYVSGCPLPYPASTWGDPVADCVCQRLRPLSYSKSHVILIAFAIDTPDSLENVSVKVRLDSVRRVVLTPGTVDRRSEEYMWADDPDPAGRV